MSHLAWIGLVCLAVAVVVGIVTIWVSDDDPAKHAERDAKEPMPPPRERDEATLDEIARDFERITGEKWPGPRRMP